MSIVQLKNIQIKRGNSVILDIPHLNIDEGSIYSIIGPSGAGKSTLLKVINGLVAPDSGSLYYKNRRMPRSSFSKERLITQRDMAYVFQKPVLYDTTVFENVAIGLRYRGQSSSDIQKQVEWALDLVHLRSFQLRDANTLSGGEAQRMAFARAIAVEPSLLILDEATSNLDPAHVRLMENVVTTLKENNPTMTILLVTHSLEQAKQLSDRSIFMYQGRLIEENGTKVLFNEPTSSLLQSFLAYELL